MKNDSLLLVGLAVGTLVIGGAAVAGVMLLRKPGAAGTPASGTPAPTGASGSLTVGNGVTAVVGSGTSGWSVQQALAQQQAKEAEWRRADKINSLERDLATCQNEIKRLTDQLNVIDATPMSQEHIAAWSQAHMQSCKSAFVFGFGCDKRNDLSEGWDVKAKDDWARKQEAQKRPILTRLSELNSQQLSLIQNLRDLGVVKQPANVRIT